MAPDGSPWSKAAWIFGPGNGAQAQAPATALRIQTSILGRPRPIGCGRSRLAGNLVDYNDLKAFPISQGGKGALGGGGKGGTSGFTYTVAPIFAISEGPILAISKVWDQNGDVHTNLGDYNISIKLGDYAQVPFGYMTTNHPDKALGYRGLSLSGSFPMSLGSNAVLPNLSYEALWVISGAYGGVDDADPAAWITAFLTDLNWGVGFPTEFLGPLTQLSNWAIATGMVISEAMTERREADSYLTDIATAIDGEFIWSNGLLDFVPYGDVIVIGNGVTFTPAIDPLWDFTDADFLPNSGGVSASVTSFTSEDPVIGSRNRTKDMLNQILIEFFDRSNNYNPTIADAKDDAAIQLYGINPSDTKSFHFFAIRDAAVTSAHLQLGRQEIRNQFTWTADQRFIWLDPMDVVNLKDPKLNGNLVFPVRITEITENQQDKSLTFTAEEYLQGTGTPFGYDAQNQCCPSGRPSFNLDPGPTIFAYWDASLCGAPDGPSIIFAAAGSGIPASAREGMRGVIAEWYYPTWGAANPSTAGTVPIFKSTTNDANSDSFSLVYVQDGAGHYQIGIEVVATDTTGAIHTFNGLSAAANVSSVPVGGIGILGSWDFSGNTWSIRIRLNGGVVTLSTSAVGASMDGDHFPLFEALNGVYSMGVNSALGAFKWSHSWIGVDGDIEGMDLTLGDVVYEEFYGDISTHANAPEDLNADGSGVMGCPPTFYFAQAPGTGTGAGHEGISTGCLAGTVFPSATGSGGASSIGAGTIPASPSGYQAVGTSFSANYTIFGPEPFSGVNQAWGSAEVWISTNGTDYSNAINIDAPSPIGKLTANYPIGADPDTTDILSVDLTESVGSLIAYSATDADAGRSRCVIMGSNPEIINYTAAALTGSHKYNLGTYVRRGQLGTAIAAHVIGDTFAQLGNNAVKINYPVSLIGTNIHVKFLARNTVGGGLQTLAEVPDHIIALVGPAVPTPPATLIALEAVASSGSVVLSWPKATCCGIASYDVAYNTGGPDTIVNLGNQLSTVLAGLAPAAYTFKVRTVDALNRDSTWTTTTLTVT